jgi:hypothetical protein
LDDIKNPVLEYSDAHILPVGAFQNRFTTVDLKLKLFSWPFECLCGTMPQVYRFVQIFRKWWWSDEISQSWPEFPPNMLFMISKDL